MTIASVRHLLAAVLVAAAEPATAFELDVTPSAAAILLAEPLVGNMAVGQVGHLAVYASFCAGEGRLRVPFLTRLEAGESPFKHFKIERLASGGLALETTAPRAGVGRALAEQVAELAVVGRCEIIVAALPDPRLVEVETVNGLRHLSELLRATATAGTTPPSTDGAEAATP